jgi:hypothetical protein
MPRYAAYYRYGAGDLPEGGPGCEALDCPENWAWMEETLPLSLGDRLYETVGTFIEYDSKEWTLDQYRAVLGFTMDTIDFEEIAMIQNLGFRVRTNPEVVGKTLVQVDDEVPLFFVESTDPALAPYGYDKNGTFIRLPSA